jgi:hypothetical protein
MLQSGCMRHCRVDVRMELPSACMQPPQRCNATAEAVSRASAVFPLLLQAEIRIGMKTEAVMEETAGKMQKESAERFLAAWRKRSSLASAPGNAAANAATLAPPAAGSLPPAPSMAGAAQVRSPGCVM